MVPVRHSRKDLRFEFLQQLAIVMPFLRCRFCELSFGVARVEARQHVVAVDVLEVIGDPVDQPMPGLAEFRRRCIQLHGWMIFGREGLSFGFRFLYETWRILCRAYAYFAFSTARRETENRSSDPLYLLRTQRREEFEVGLF